jgi:hypothetical protein
MITRPILTIKSGNKLILRDDLAIETIQVIDKSELKRNMDFDVVHVENNHKKYRSIIETKKCIDPDNLRCSEEVKVYSSVKLRYELPEHSNEAVLPRVPICDSVSAFSGSKGVSFELVGRKLSSQYSISSVVYRPIFTMKLVDVSCRSCFGIDCWKLEFEEV